MVYFEAILHGLDFKSALLNYAHFNIIITENLFANSQSELFAHLYEIMFCLRYLAEDDLGKNLE